MNPRPLLRPIRRAMYVACAAMLLYLFLRFDLHRLPEEGCSPLLRFVAGDDLLLDRRPGRIEPGEALLVQGDDGLLYLVAVERVREGEAGRELWVQTDAPDCPGRDSDELGWVPEDRVAARVAMVWPW